MGIKTYSCIQEEIDAIANMRQTRDHPILEEIEIMLITSIADFNDIATDLIKAEKWILDINDILLGKRDINNKRDTEKYKKKTSSIKVKKRLFKYIINLEKNKNKHSPFLQEIIVHFRKTYNNWQQYLFTCYDIIELPNTNNELELSHSKLKRKHRRITGKMYSNQFLLIHGEQASHCVNIELSNEEIVDIFIKTDYEKIKKRFLEEKAKSHERGDKMRSHKNINSKLKQIKNNWNMTC